MQTKYKQPCNQCGGDIYLAPGEGVFVSNGPVCPECRDTMRRKRDADLKRSHVPAKQVKLLFPGSHTCLPGQQDLF